MLSESQEDSSEVTAGEMRKTRNREITGTALVISYNGVTETKVTNSRLTPYTIYTSASVS
jgi:hypothetical protein